MLVQIVVVHMHIAYFSISCSCLNMTEPYLSVLRHSKRRRELDLNALRLLIDWGLERALHKERKHTNKTSESSQIQNNIQEERAGATK